MAEKKVEERFYLDFKPTEKELALIDKKISIYGLNPEIGEIKFYKKGPQLITVIPLEGYRKLTQQFWEGKGITTPWSTDRPSFEGEIRYDFTVDEVVDGEVTQRKETKFVPEFCEIELSNGGSSVFGVAYFEEFCSGSHFWYKMPHHMIERVAEAKAHKKLTPSLIDTYSEEEFDNWKTPLKGPGNAIDKAINEFTEALKSNQDTSVIKKKYTYLEKSGLVDPIKLNELKSKLVAYINARNTKQT